MKKLRNKHSTPVDFGTEGTCRRQPFRSCSAKARGDFLAPVAQLQPLYPQIITPLSSSALSFSASQPLSPSAPQPQPTVTVFRSQCNLEG
mmetsp:Transcript_4222/g.6667  ORF Transcript_4222/g.6667 Transcript_4222/m.6667 type:complete len:90 (-) Transcript_4222:569-838(-)